MTTPPGDWYAELRLQPDASTNEIAQAVEKRSRQATALANTAPERSQLLREQVRAMKRDLLSGDDARQRYDAARAANTGQLPTRPTPLGGGAPVGQPSWQVGLPPPPPPPPSAPLSIPGPAAAGNSTGRAGYAPPPVLPPGSGRYPPGVGGSPPRQRQPLPLAWMAAIACVVVATVVVVVLVVMKMHSDSQNAQGSTDALTSGSDTSSSNTGTPSSSASTSRSVSSTSPTTAPSTPTPTFPPGATPVTLGPAVHPDSTSIQVAELFSRYLTAINKHDYYAYRTSFSHPVQSQSAFQNGYQTTVDSNATLTAVEIGSDGRPVATLAFTSHQARGDGPTQDPNQTCSKYQLPFLLDGSAGRYRIDNVVSNHPPPRACTHG